MKAIQVRYVGATPSKPRLSDPIKWMDVCKTLLGVGIGLFGMLVASCFVETLQSFGLLS